MPDFRATQPSFTAGELAPGLYARRDLARYQVGCSKLSNCFVHAHGGVSNRAGLRFAAKVKDSSKAVRLTKFEAAPDEAFLLVWGDANVRPMFEGAWLDNLGSPYEVATPYLEAHLADIYTEQSNDVSTVTHPDFPVYELARFGLLDWRIAPVSFASSIPAPVNPTAVGTEAFTGYGGDKLPLFYTYAVAAIGRNGEESLPSEEFTSDIDLVMGYDKNFVTLSWTSSAGGEAGAGVPNWTDGNAAQTHFHRGFTLANDATVTHVGVWSANAVAGMAAKIAQKTGAGAFTINRSQNFNHPGGGWHYVKLTTSYVVPATGVHHAGIYSPAAIKNARATVMSVKAGNIGTGAQTGFTDATSNTYATRVKYAGIGDAEIEGFNVYKEENGVFGLIGYTTDLTFKDLNAAPSFATGPQSGYNPFIGDGNYPQLVTYVQQRRTFAATEEDPQTIFMTQSGNFSNMGVSRPARDDDAVTFTLASRKKQDIHHIVPLERGMIVFTRSGEWRVTGREGDVITPSSILPEPQTEYGSVRNLKPLVIGSQLLFIPRTGRRVLELGFSLQNDRYSANDLAVMSYHLFQGRQVVAWDYAEDPDNLIYCVMSDGAGLTLTYMKEHDVWGWGRFTTRGKLLDVCVVPEATRDVPYFAVERRIGGVREKYIEYIEDRHKKDIRDAFFVDSGLSLDNPIAIDSIALGAETVITAAAHGLVDGDTVEVDGLIFVNDDDEQVMTENPEGDAMVAPINGRWIVADATTNTFALTWEYDNDPLEAVQGGPLVSTEWEDAYFVSGVWRKCVATVSGIDHLEARKVIILADGNVIEGETVTDGAIALGAKHARVHVGLGYQSVLGTLDIINPQGDDAGITKGAAKVYVRVENTRGIKVGQTEENAVEDFTRDDEFYTDAARPYTGMLSVDIWDDWEQELPLYIVQDYPLPMTILAATKEVEYGGHSVQIVDYEPEHGAHVASNIRPADRREIYHLAMISPEVAIRVTTANAVAAWTITIDDVPAAIFGINRRSRLSTIGCPWMLATPEVERYPVRMVKDAIPYVERMKRAFPVMVNYVSLENTKSIRWLRALGFDMEEAKPYGAFGAAFIRFGKGSKMCVDPVTLLTIGSTLVSAVGTVAQGQATAAAADYQQKQQTMLAEDALRRGAQEEEAQRRKTAALAGRQRAVMAASGLDLGSGSPLAILGDTAMLGELDAQVIKDNARRQQSFHKGNAVLAGMESKAANTAGIIGGFSTVLGGATQMASSWYKPGKGGGGYDPWDKMRSKS